MNESNRWVEQLMAEDYLYTNKDFIVSAINVFTGTLFGWYLFLMVVITSGKQLSLDLIHSRW